jgi:hypothetical protein
MSEHACSTHAIYKLSCEQYDALRAARDGRCWRCDTQTERLCVDHDHSLGISAVRGIVCFPCNGRLGQVDAGAIHPDDADTAYLAAAWHRSEVAEHKLDGRTPVRHIRIDELWDDAQATAAGQGDTVPDVVRLALRAYVADPTATMVALTQIRGGGR